MSATNLGAVDIINKQSKAPSLTCISNYNNV